MTDEQTELADEPLTAEELEAVALFLHYREHLSQAQPCKTAPFAP